ncbi:secretin N-terminal domain-containing protein [Maricaulis sp. CAU 1757]
MTSCASQSGPPEERWMQLTLPVTASDTDASNGPAAIQLGQTPESDRLGPDVDVRSVPSISPGRSASTIGPREVPRLSGELINVTLPPQPLPAFLNTVFGEILEQPFTLGPEVLELDETISLRSVRDMPPATFLALVEEALKDYGLGVTYENGLFRVVQLDELRAQMPRFITSRAHSDVPSGLRPVVQFVQLSAIDVADMQAILEQALPNRSELMIRNNRRTNALILSGLADDVNAALAIIDEMDELQFAGTQVVTFSPANWDATELATTLNEILTLEGFTIGVGSGFPRPITLLPLAFTNQLMIFASDRMQADHVLELARDLDAEAYRGEARNPFVYQVLNADASSLAQIVGSVIGGGAAGSGVPAGQGSTGGSEGGPAGVTSIGNLTIDEQGNRIIFFGTQAEFEQVSTLLRQLDTPVPEVLIEVTIAEVTLTDDSSYSLDLIFDSEIAPRFTASLASNDGFSGVVETGEVTLTASASAGNNQINVLSTPRIVTRSGVEGSVQVGTDVPIITSQRAATTQTGGSSDILQTVQYRSTGILLTVEPRVYSGNRIDLTINQEVSSAEANENTAIASPVISNRSLSSQLSLQDGQTAVLGGLIENRFTRGNTGVPFLKDIPVVGMPFRGETLSSTRTMLVVLVTPYILDTRNDRQVLVDALVGAMNRNFSNQTGRSRTLVPPSEPMQIRPAGWQDTDEPGP